ncbi:MAG: hypothetical protein U9R53_01865 [Chloroflexota bacterium]|nr:hypothetical protein [Chloroflexota bacterium]
MAVKKIRSLQDKTKPLFRISTLVIIIFQLVSCSFPGLPVSTNELQIDPETELATEPVNLQFNLQIPNILSEDESIALEFLDEVTGLSYNSQTFELKQVTDHEYIMNLSVHPGFVLKYRYIKTGQVSTPEVQINGEPVLYRLCYVHNRNSITDVIYAWQGETNNHGLGVLKGTIRDQESDSPIPDILVSAGGQLTFTDANGEFIIGGLPQGEHNVMFYAMDGKYEPHQQSAQISSGLSTPANVKLHLQAPIKVTFTVTPPSEAIGAPIYIAGNILQLGNTFSNQPGSTSIFPKNMPALTMQEDGTYTLELNLYSGTDLRYKFTLGDGFWNAEQRESIGVRIRQLIVPSHDIELDINIDTWRVPGYAPITFHVSVPNESSPTDEKFIQFKTTDWTHPLPLWPVGNAEYLYILFSPLDDQSPISYRFCRNADCQKAINLGNENQEPQIIPSDSANTISTTIDAWENWQPLEVTTTFPIPPAPLDTAQYVTAIELTPDMNPSWQVYASLGMEDIAEMGTKSVIFSPQWFLKPTLPFLTPEFGRTPFTYEMLDLMNTAQSLGLNRSLYPQLDIDDSTETWWLTRATSNAWWDEWFKNYRQLILNYVKIAEKTNTDQLILGGKAILPTFIGGIFPDGRESDVPENSEALWLDLIGDIRAGFHGDLIWATNVSQKVDPLPEFIDQFDGLYIIIDSPLSSRNDASFEEIALNFTNVIDNFIYEIYRSTLMPVTLALAYPSVDGAAKGCALLNTSCYNDGLFLYNEIAANELDLKEQALIYSAILPIIASRGWITGTAIRGYLPTVIVQDGSSSISGKPASEIINIWFKDIKDDFD